MASYKDIDYQQRSAHPPTDDPLLPSYECADYLASAGKRRVMADVYAGDLNMGDDPERYLPRNTNEGSAYNGRLIRTVFENHTAPIINAYSGTLSMVDYDNVPPAIMDWEQDIDMAGNSLSSFFDAVDIAAMRDSRTYVLVDYWQEDINDRTDELELFPRPFLRHVMASQIINYEVERGRFGRCSIKECHEIKQMYGATTETVYRVMVGGDWRVVRLIQDKTQQNKWIEQIVLDDDGQELVGQYLDAKGRPLECCPIVIYRITGASVDQPFFYDLAKLNIRLYQSQSDYWELLHKCNWPVPCFTVARGADLKQPDGSISIGPNDALILGESGGAFYLQPSGDSAAASHEAIAEIRNAINSYGLTSSLSAGEGKARTATEIRMTFASVQKQIARFAEQKKSALTSVVELMGYYLGLSVDQVGSIEVASDISALLTDEASIIGLYGAGLLSLDAAVTRLTQLGYQPDAVAELGLLKAAEQQLQDKMVAELNPPTDYDGT